MTNPTYREKVNKRQMELYYAMLKNPDTAREFRIKQKQSYLKNKDKIRTATNNKRKRDKDHLIALLGGKCIVCGITNPILLEFHHIDPTHKDFDISKGLSGNWESSELLEKEAKKCELLCANCHRLKTHQP